MHFDQYILRYYVKCCVLKIVFCVSVATNKSLVLIHGGLLSVSALRDIYVYIICLLNPTHRIIKNEGQIAVTSTFHSALDLSALISHFPPEFTKFELNFISDSSYSSTTTTYAICTPFSS